MTDPWQEFRTGAEVTTAAPTDPWAQYTAPGLNTPRAPQELRASPEDKYRAAAIADRQRLISAGVPVGEGYTERLGRGAGLGWTDEIMAAGTVPLEMIRRGTLDPREAYRYGKAREDVRREATDKNTAGLLGGAAEVVGGLTTGAGVLGAGTRVGAQAIPFTSRQIPGTLANYGANVLKAGGMGSIMGAGEAKDIAGIPSGMITGGLLGAGVGAVAQPVIAMAAPALRTLTQAPRLRSPQNVATEEVAAVARAAGVTPQEIVRRIEDAHAAGQTGFTVADAIGHEGQRKVAALAKVPGEQRQLIVDALQARRANKAARIGEEYGQAFGAPGTSEAAREALIAKAKETARPLYQEAERYPTWSNRLQEFFDDPIAKAGLRQGEKIQRLEAVGEGRRYNPRDAMITDFDAAGDPIITGVPNMRTIHTLKVGLDRLIEAQQNPITGGLTAEGRALLKYQQGLLREVDAINPTYAEARRAYAGPMSVASAVRAGEGMATSGRAADNVRTFGEMSPTEQQGARIGYASKQLEPLERSGNIPPTMLGKSLKGATEGEALSLYQGPRRPGEPDQFRKFMNREEQMQRGEQAALGGSSTAENVADIATTPSAAADIAMGLAGAAASGSPFTFTQRALAALGNVAKAESQAQRNAITEALLINNPDMARQMADRIAIHELRRRGVNPWRPDAPPRYRAGE